MALEETALTRFDGLVEQGEVIWQKSAPRYVSCKPFDLQFHVANGLTRKPRTAGSKKRTPAFTDDPEEFTLGLFGTRHKLILNKFCAVRPQMVLHTVEFESQDELLNKSDFQAAWLALNSLGENYMVIFNGGKDAGASLNHKHLQVVPRPEKAGLETLLEGCDQNSEASSRLKDVPFKMALRKLPDNPDASSLHDLFLALREENGLKDGEAYNMILLRQYMIVIPRRSANIDGIDANAAGMLGFVWCSSEEQYQEWQQRGCMHLLQEFGVPKDN